jgi:flagellin
MALTVATNTGALMAQAAASSVNKEMEISMERLSTGLRINGASDDAAGVAIASRLTSEIKGTNMAIRNAMDGQALIDTAEGAHQEIESILQRMRELSVQARNDTNSATDRANLQTELESLTAEINRIAEVTTWSGQKLLTGTGGNNGNGTFNVQAGSRSSTHDTITATISSMSATGLNIGSSAADDATLSLVGSSLMQVGGTPKSGDSFSFTINGESAVLKITNDTTDTGDGADFGFSLDIAGGGASAFTTGITADLGLTKHAVADALAAAIAEVAKTSTNSSGHLGLTATASSDGSVTLSQSLEFGAQSFDASASATAAVAGTIDNAANTLTFSNSQLGTLKAGDAFSFVINGETVSYTTNATDGFDATTDAGVVAGLQSAIDAEVNIKGVTAAASVNGSGDIIITLTDNTSLSVSATPKAGSSTTLSITTSTGADDALTKIDAALTAVNTQRAKLGSVSNRLDSTVSNLTNISANLEGGRGRIQDADFAAETTSLAKSQILQQASTAMLAQANASKQNVLSLLQG